MQIFQEAFLVLVFQEGHQLELILILFFGYRLLIVIAKLLQIVV